MAVYILGDMASPQILHAEHQGDVLAQWLAWREDGPVALIAVTRTEGGAVRAPGALLAVSLAGDRAGYVSGGCIDEDVALQARDALSAGEAHRALRYGAGSPFLDLPLPCGGAIEVDIAAALDPAEVRAWHDALARREAVRVAWPLPGGPGFTWRPKLRIRIAGRGADALALARLAKASGLETALSVRNTDDLHHARALGLEQVDVLTTPSDLPDAGDDPWTAFVLMFHDGDWEAPLIRQALAGPTFYIGAVGSRRTHARRCETLRSSGLPEPALERLHGPVGLVPSLRDASLLAVSTLAEIIAAWQALPDAPDPLSETALILLAAGASSRFEAGDKLLAPFRGAPLLGHAAAALAGTPLAARIAVTGPGQDARAEALAGAGWQVAVNPDAADGQGASLAAGIRRVADHTRARRALVLLADMPLVPDAHLVALARAAAPGVPAVLSRAGTVTGPPAVFDRTLFAQLATLTGDRGARAVVAGLDGVITLPLAPDHALDIDCEADLARALEPADG